MAKKDGIISIGFDYKKELEKMIREFESEMDSVSKNTNLSKGMKTQFDNITAEMRKFKSGIEQELSNLGSGKVNQSSFKSFKQNVENKFKGIREDINRLDLAVSTLNSSVDILGKDVDLSKIRNEFKGFEDYVTRTHSAVESLIDTLGEQGISLFSFDNRNIADFKNTIKQINDATAALDKDVGEKFELFDEKEAQNELNKLSTQLVSTLELMENAKKQMVSMDSSTDGFKKARADFAAFQLQAASLNEIIETLYETTESKGIYIKMDDKSLSTYEKYTDDLSDNLESIISYAQNAKKEVSSLLDKQKASSVKISSEMNPNSAEFSGTITIETTSSELWKILSPIMDDLQGTLNSNPVVAPVKLVVAPTAVSSKETGNLETNSAYSKKYQKVLAKTGEDAVIDLEGVYKKTFTSIMDEAVSYAKETIGKIQGTFENSPIKLHFDFNEEEFKTLSKELLSGESDKKIDITGEVSKAKKEVDNLATSLGKVEEILSATDDKKVSFKGFDKFAEDINKSLGALTELQDMLKALQNIEITLAKASGVSSVTEIESQWENVSKLISNAVKLDGTFRKNANVNKLASEYSKYLDMGGSNKLSDIGKIKDNEEIISSILSKVKELNNQKVDNTSVDKTDEGLKSVSSTLDDVISRLDHMINLTRDIGNTFYKMFKDASISDIDKQWSSIENKFSSIADESGKINLAKQKKDIQELMEMYQKYVNAGGMKSPFDLTDNAETIRKLNKVYEQLNDSRKGSSSVSKESEDFDTVKESVDNLTSAINVKTEAIKTEANTMELAARAEVKSIQKIIDALNPLIEKIQSVPELKIPKESDVVSSDKSNISSENELQETVNALKQLAELPGGNTLSLGKIMDHIANGAKLANPEVKKLLESLQLLNSEGEIIGTHINEGTLNSGVDLNKNFAIISRNNAIEDVDKLIAKEKEAEQQGVILAKTLASLDIGDLHYDIQELAQGKSVHQMKDSSLQQFVAETKTLCNATDEQILKLYSDAQKLSDLGFKLDLNPSNIRYDENSGFGFIDLELRKINEEAPQSISILHTLTQSLMGFMGQRSRLNWNDEDNFYTEDNYSYLQNMLKTYEHLQQIFSSKLSTPDFNTVFSENLFLVKSRISDIETHFEEMGINIKSTMKDVFQNDPDSSSTAVANEEVSAMEKVENATEQAAQAKQDFVTANENVQSSVDGSKSPLQLEAELMQQIAKDARDAANAKKEFVEANKQVEQSANNSNDFMQGKNDFQSHFDKKQESVTNDYSQEVIDDFKSIVSAIRLTDEELEEFTTHYKILKQIGRVGEKAFSIKLQKNDGQTENWYLKQNEQGTYDRKRNILSTDYKGFEKTIIAAENKLRNLEATRNEVLSINSNANVSGINEEIEYQRAYVDLLDKTAQYLKRNEETLLQGVQIEKARNDAMQEYYLKQGTKQDIQNAKQSVSDEQKRLKNIEQVNRALNKQQILIDSIERTYNKDVNPDLDKAVTDTKDLEKLEEKKEKIKSIISELKDQDRNPANEDRFQELEKLISEYKELAKYKLKANNPSEQKLGGTNLEVAIEQQIAQYDKLIIKAEKYGDETSEIVKNLKKQRNILTAVDKKNGIRTATSDDYTNARDEYKIANAQVSSIEAQAKANEQKAKAIEKVAKASEKQIETEKKKADIERKTQAKETQSFVNSALKQQETAWKNIQSIREKISKADPDNKEYIAQLQDAKKFYQEQYIEAGKVLKANQDLYDSELQVNKLKQIQLETTAEITKHHNNLNLSKKDSLLNSLNAYDDSTKYTSDFINRVQDLKDKISDINITNPKDVDDLINIESSINSIISASKLFENKLVKQNSKIADIVSKMKIFRDSNTNMYSSQKAEINNLIDYAETIEKSGKVTADAIEKVKINFSRFKADVVKTGRTGLNLIDQIVQRTKDINSKFFAQYFSIQDWINYIKQGIQTVRELDTAFVEMQKVSDESVLSLKAVQDASFDLANSVGTTAIQMQNSIADFMRIGDSVEEAQKHAIDANTLLQVSEFDNIEDATSALVSMNQAWKDVDTQHINDVLNILGNNMPIATDELASSLQRSAGTLATLGATIEEAAALTVAGNVNCLKIWKHILKNIFNCKVNLKLYATI